MKATITVRVTFSMLDFLFDIFRPIHRTSNKLFFRTLKMYTRISLAKNEMREGRCDGRLREWLRETNGSADLNIHTVKKWMPTASSAETDGAPTISTWISQWAVEGLTPPPLPPSQKESLWCINQVQCLTGDSSLCVL